MELIGQSDLTSFVSVLETKVRDLVTLTIISVDFFGVLFTSFLFFLMVQIFFLHPPFPPDLRSSSSVITSLRLTCVTEVSLDGQI